MWQQASAEGITVLVSSGDQGSSACDPTEYMGNAAVHSMAVSGLASTPYNLAVGGTDFNQHKFLVHLLEFNERSRDQGVGVGYIPEIPGTPAAAALLWRRSTMRPPEWVVLIHPLS